MKQWVKYATASVIGAVLSLLLFGCERQDYCKCTQTITDSEGWSSTVETIESGQCSELYLDTVRFGDHWQEHKIECK